MNDSGFFYFNNTLFAEGDPQLNNATIRALWRGFCFQSGTLSVIENTPFHVRAGDVDIPEIPAGHEYAICVTARGFAVAGRDYPSLVRGFMVLMMRIEPVNLTIGAERFRIEACHLVSKYTIENRMIHLCVFPETTPLFLKKAVRLAGVMQYTHVVLEFWGMLQYDSLKELAWGNAYSKALAAELIQEIRDMGMEVIPMFNHLGHASACRASGGKHVVLDQNPRLGRLFSPDGWSWNIDNEESRILLRRVRRELYDLCGSSTYFHLGCDEVYSYDTGDTDQRRMRWYLHDIIEEVKAEGKKPIIWGDMLLNYQACGVGKPYYCSCDTPENAEKMIEAIPKDTIIADWHYDNLEGRIETSIYLKNKGFQVLGAPWFETANCRVHADTIRENNLLGIMVTTWHTLAQKMYHVVWDALICGAYQSPWSGTAGHKIETETAALLRKVCFVQGDYLESGWTDHQVFLQARPMV